MKAINNKYHSTTNLDSLKDLAELKLILILHCGQAQNRGSLLVNNLYIKEYIRYSVFARQDL
jgi:hypothetical protein